MSNLNGNGDDAGPGTALEAPAENSSRIEVLAGGVNVGKMGPNEKGQYELALILDLRLALILDDPSVKHLANVFAEQTSGIVIPDIKMTASVKEKIR